MGRKTRWRCPGELKSKGSGVVLDLVPAKCRKSSPEPKSGLGAQALRRIRESDQSQSDTQLWVPGKVPQGCPCGWFIYFSFFFFFFFKQKNRRMLPCNSVKMCSNPVTIGQVTIAPSHQELPPYLCLGSILLVANQWGRFFSLFFSSFPCAG